MIVMTAMTVKTVMMEVAMKKSRNTECWETPWRKVVTQKRINWRTGEVGRLERSSESSLAKGYLR